MELTATELGDFLCCRIPLPVSLERHGRRSKHEACTRTLTYTYDWPEFFLTEIFVWDKHVLLVELGCIFGCLVNEWISAQ